MEKKSRRRKSGEEWGGDPGRGGPGAGGGGGLREKSKAGGGGGRRENYIPAAKMCPMLGSKAKDCSLRPGWSSNRLTQGYRILCLCLSLIQLLLSILDPDSDVTC